MAKEMITKNFKFLIQNMDPAPILDILIQRGHTNVENIRTECRNDRTVEANRQIIESLPRMKDGRGYEHFIEALKEENLTFVLEKLGFHTDVTPATEHVTQSASNLVEPVQIRSHSTVVQGAVRNPSSDVTGSSVLIGGAHLDESEGATNSQAKDENFHDNVADVLHKIKEHESGMNVRLVKPTTLRCSINVHPSCPDELSALTRDAAWHAHINDTTIDEVVKNLGACPAGTYIMWYSKRKGAMLVSVAVPDIPKKHVHFKMLRTEIQGVPYYHFDGRLLSKDPLAVLQYVKKNGLIINHAKLRHYKSQT